MRHAVANSLDVDEGVRRDAPRQALLSNGQRPRRQRPQRLSLLALEAIERPLVRRAVNPRVGGDDPRREMRLERDEAVIFDGVAVVARHRRVREPFTRVVDPGHFAGLMRPHDDAAAVTPILATHGRTLDDYAAVVAGAA